MVGFAIMGFFKGFICGVFEIAGVIIGIYMGYNFASMLANVLPDKVPLYVRLPISAVLIGFIAFIVIKLIGWLIQKVIVHGPLKLLNKLAGLAMGGIQGALVVVFILMVIGMTPFYNTLEQERNKSKVLDFSLVISKPIIKSYKTYLLKKDIKVTSFSPNSNYTSL